MSVVAGAHPYLLDATLRSLHLHCRDLAGVRVEVLLSPVAPATEPDSPAKRDAEVLRAAHRAIALDYPGVGFTEAGAEDPLVPVGSSASTAEPAELGTVALLAEGVVFLGPFEFTPCVHALLTAPDACGFTLCASETPASALLLRGADMMKLRAAPALWDAQAWAEHVRTCAEGATGAPLLPADPRLPTAQLPAAYEAHASALRTTEYLTGTRIDVAALAVDPARVAGPLPMAPCRTPVEGASLPLLDAPMPNLPGIQQPQSPTEPGRTAPPNPAARTTPMLSVLVACEDAADLARFAAALPPPGGEQGTVACEYLAVLLQAAPTARAEVATPALRLLGAGAHGHAAAWNRAARAARGAYLVSVTADMPVDPARLGALCERLDAAAADVAIAYTPSAVDAAAPTLATLLRTCAIPQASVLRRAVWDLAGGYVEKPAPGTALAAHWAMMVAALQRGFRCELVPGPIPAAPSAAAITAAAPHIARCHPGLFPVATGAARPPLAHGTGDTSAPLVTVIVATRNRPELLERALGSVLAQTMQDFEVIVVNDAGVPVEGRVAALDPAGRIQCIRAGRTTGPGGARNLGIALARGRYLAYLDDDDAFYPRHLETLLTALDGREARAAYTDALRSHVRWDGTRWLLQGRDRPFSERFDRDLLAYRNYVPILCVLHERSLLEEVGRFDASLSVTEDWEFWLRLADVTDFVHVPAVTCEFSHRSDGTGVSNERRALFPHLERLVRRRGGRVVDAPALAAEHLRRRRRGMLQGRHGDESGPALRAAFGGLLRAQPDNSAAAVGLACLQHRAGDTEGAQRLLEQALQGAPDAPEVREDLAALALASGEAERARDLLAPLLNARTCGLNAVLLAGDVQLGLGDLGGAAKYYRGALEARPNVESISRLSNLELLQQGSQQATPAPAASPTASPAAPPTASPAAPPTGTPAKPNVGHAPSPQASAASEHAAPAVGGADAHHPGNARSVRLSVVMPYYENHRTLERCLRSFADQAAALGGCELIVVDDGSTHPARPIVDALVDPPAHPATEQLAEGWQRLNGMPIRLLDGAHGGQSAATNQGIRAARGEVVLLTCADIIAGPGLLSTHLEVHGDASEAVAVGGAIPYAQDVPMTPFMRYLSGDGPQFSFHLIRDPERMPGDCCYAPNFSARRVDLIAHGAFDERFVYGMQDTDLGYRLQRAGVRLRYRAAAVAFHDHPTDLRAYVGRQRRVGSALWLMLEKYPDFVDLGRLRSQIADVQPRLPLFDELVTAVVHMERDVAGEQEAPAEVVEKLHGFYDLVLQFAFIAGVLEDGERVAALQQGRAPGRLQEVG